MCKIEQDPPQICLFQRESDITWMKLRSQDVPSLVLTQRLIEAIQGIYYFLPLSSGIYRKAFHLR